MAGPTSETHGSFAEMLVDESPDALFALSVDGRVLFWNRGAELEFGYSRTEAIGRSITDLIVPDDQLQQAREALAQASEQGLATFECVRRRKDGSRIHVDVSMRRGTLAGDPVVVTRQRNIDELKRLREDRASAERFRGLLERDATQRNRAEDKFRGLLEGAPDAMVISGRDGRIALVNAQTEALFGYPRAELIGQPIEILVPERFRDQHLPHRSAYFVMPKARPMRAGLDLFGRRKDGTEFAAEISLSPIVTPEGTLVTAAIRDVTERKRDMDERNRRMEEANRLKSEFLTGMSHELRTPLNAIIGFAALMRAGKAGPMSDAQHEYMGDILSSGRHLLQLINDILDLAKVESGKMDLRIEAVDLGRLAGEVRDILRALAAERRVHIHFDVDASLSPVSIDPRLLKQVLYNFLSNAIKFTPDHGKVALRILPESDDRFRVEVEDNGIGIQPGDMARLFVEFQQLDSGLARKHSGTGLGLALTKRIVEAQGGRVGVTSELGTGSTFWAVLPRNVTPPGAGTKG